MNSELANFTNRNNQYSSNNNDQSEDELKRNWVGREQHSISISGLKNRLNGSGTAAGEEHKGEHPERITISRRDQTSRERRPYSAQRALRLISKIRDCTLEDNRCFGLNCMAPLINPAQFEVQLDERGHRTRSIYK